MYNLKISKTNKKFLTFQIIKASSGVEEALSRQYAPLPPPPALPDSFAALRVNVQEAAPPRPPPPAVSAPPRPPPPDTDDEGEDIFNRQPHPSQPILVSSNLRNNFQRENQTHGIISWTLFSRDYFVWFLLKSMATSLLK